LNAAAIVNLSKTYLHKFKFTSENQKKSSFKVLDPDFVHFLLLQQEMEFGKTGIKTIDRLSQIPVFSSAIANSGDYYGKFKEKNILLRTSFNLAELSLRTVAFAATPITTFCKKPCESSKIFNNFCITTDSLLAVVEKVDDYLCDKVDLLESNCPFLKATTEQVCFYLRFIFV
jgi:hypothetical protein